MMETHITQLEKRINQREQELATTQERFLSQKKLEISRLQAIYEHVCVERIICCELTS